MKKSPVFYFKTTLVVLGFLLIALGFFTEFRSTCGFMEDDQELILPISISGSQDPLWYFFSLGTAVIFGVGYFFPKLANKILVYSLAGILALFIAFVTWISQAGWGRPCGYSCEYGYSLTLFGSLFVLIATIISMHRSNQLPTGSYSDDLLDQGE